MDTSDQIEDAKEQSSKDSMKSVDKEAETKVDESLKTDDEMESSSATTSVKTKVSEKKHVAANEIPPEFYSFGCRPVRSRAKPERFDDIIYKEVGFKRN